MQIRISVRNLVEFILRSGSIDNRRTAASDAAMAEGSRLHRMLQRRMGADYQAEVFLRRAFHRKEYDIVIEGRADGVLPEPDGFMIEEIKGTYRDIMRMQEAVPVHLAQAKCYAYLYAAQYWIPDRGGVSGEESAGCAIQAHGREPAIRIRMTYCNLDTEELRYFHYEDTWQGLSGWFEGLLADYLKWADMEHDWKEKRQASIHDLSFPFSYRKGQKELAAYVYQTICHKRKLFLEAPTGVGKTISVIFPAVKAVGEKKADRIFYLTAKTVTQVVAEETFSLLREHGLAYKTVLLTARDKICFLEEAECNPQACPYADGHYDRINEALYEILTHEVNYTAEKIRDYAERYRVCPFEMGLDISLFCDAVICDYNYVFDPHVYLRRFFGENTGEESLFLVDEAHNLVERGREMYSASLWKEDFLRLKHRIHPVNAKIAGQLEKCNRALLSLKRECEDWRIVERLDPFMSPLIRLHTSLTDFLEEGREPIEAALQGEILEFYFAVSHFLEMYELMDENYTAYTKMEEDGRFLLRIYCVNPGKNLRECMARARSSILFSATMLPIRYYKELLGGEETDYEVYAPSAFDSRRCAVFTGSGVTTRYTRRGEAEYRNIACYIYETVKNRRGNYMIFFPSYLFLQRVYEIYLAEFWDGETQECLVQESHMGERARGEFLRRFLGNEELVFSDVIDMEIEVEEEKSLLGFCVMGGIFGEGIDLKKDSLIGVLIVGTGIPQVCPEREILKQYFDREGNGFDYAYRYPGMNKVLQAAGRVIRTAEDIGIVVLLDERFDSPAYRRLFPREWAGCESVGLRQISGRVAEFWKKWL